MDEALGRDVLLDRLRRALQDSGVAEADLYVRRVRRGVARYSLNTLNQHAQFVEESAAARAGVPAIDGYRLASVSTTDLSHEGLVNALKRAAHFAQKAPPIVAWPGFAPPEGEAPDPPRYAESTARCSAQIRADLVAPALARAIGSGLSAAGALETNAYEIAVANTRGLARYAEGTFATFKMFAHDADGASGFAQATHRDVDRLNIEARAAEACAKCLASRDPVALPAGEYDVLLEPPAVTELLEWMSFIAFGAREVADRTSPLAGRQGTMITGPSVTIVDDATDDGDLGFGVPFDREGTPRQRVVLIDAGRAGKPVFDRLYAAREGVPSTGHAGPPGGMFEEAPIAQSVSMAPGSETLASLMRRIDRGLHITRFHYVNGFLDPRRALMTGMTRDGTFLIERGERTRAVRNMRFTDSVLEALARTDGMTALREAVPAWWSESSAFVAPALLLRALRFTSGGQQDRG